MTIVNRQLVTTCDELLNHEGWKERMESRHKEKGHGNRIFRTFELDCGEGYKIHIGIVEMVYLSLTSMKVSKPCVTTNFSTVYGKASFRRTNITDCKDRDLFYKRLYGSLEKRFPLTDLDVQTTKVW